MEGEGKSTSDTEKTFSEVVDLSTLKVVSRTKRGRTSSLLGAHLVSGRVQHLRFRVHYVTQFGQLLLIAGSAPQLGEWKFGRLLTYQGDGFWDVELLLPEGITLEYKYLIMSGNTIFWEDGHNRIVSLVSADPSKVVLICDFWQAPAPASPLVSAVDDRGANDKEVVVTFNVYLFQSLPNPQAVYVVGNISHLGFWSADSANEMVEVSLMSSPSTNSTGDTDPSLQSNTSPSPHENDSQLTYSASHSSQLSVPINCPRSLSYPSMSSTCFSWYSKQITIPEQLFPFEYKFVLFQDDQMVWESGGNHVMRLKPHNQDVCVIICNAPFSTL
eukprot:TRINITY_DN4710_c0_g1_i1.p1 TRINITY_DN4710_c0_g1~~TRINITY_DN4710_c0_g1_i1.p1  ORF type:complete len:329 (-),score=39.75 TRINITY_DN4710_c0_g1_i1:157-1143(-)